ncbi:MAG: type IX secretion system protein PorQ [Bacteroidota bacterium]
MVFSSAAARRCAAFATLLTLMVLPVLAQPGTLSGFPFLRMEPSARAAALGGAYSAMYGSDVNALFYNPALLNADMHRSLSVSYLNHLSDLNAGFVSYALHREGLGTFGGGIRFMSWGEIERADENGIRDGTFSAGDVALTLGYAGQQSENLRYGANVHAVYSGIDSYSASAVAADVGVAYLVPAQLLTVSASVNNLGATLSSFGETTDELPVDLRLGVTKRLQYLPLLISVTGYNLHDLGNGPEGGTAADNIFSHLAFGGELQFSDAFQARIGYNHRRHQELKTKSRLDFAGFGLGFGLSVRRFVLDYGFNSWSSFGRLHQFTVRTSV